MRNEVRHNRSITTLTLLESYDWFIYDITTSTSLKRYSQKHFMTIIHPTMVCAHDADSTATKTTYVPTNAMLI
jgi:hypothetical protein